MIWLSDILDHLAAQGHGTAGVDLFEGSMPDGPHSVARLYAYPGFRPVRTHDGQAISRPRMQLTVRGSEYTATLTRAEAIHATLVAVVNRTLGTSRLLAVSELGSGWTRDTDESGRVLLKNNYEVLVSS